MFNICGPLVKLDTDCSIDMSVTWELYMLDIRTLTQIGRNFCSLFLLRRILHGLWRIENLSKKRKTNEKLCYYCLQNISKNLLIHNFVVTIFLALKLPELKPILSDDHPKPLWAVSNDDFCSNRFMSFKFDWYFVSALKSFISNGFYYS